ncbi:glycine-rich domain-containing protein [Calothrix sp. CCY 0018]|uniref:glycine-rich domain-containing protein n=1 Tax=Calothrix sp. CCY 0018 TaxID=3103864 RepID=UPI0039C5A9F3
MELNLLIHSILLPKAKEMLFVKSTLPTDVRKFIGKLAHLDLQPIAYRLIHSNEGKWNLQQTKQAISRYRMFLLLIYLYPNSQLIPNQEIDKVWHFHILDTMKYAEDCEMLFAKFIHHFPYLGERGKIDRDNLQKGFEQTQVLFQEHFGINMDICKKPSYAADCQPIGKITQVSRPRVDFGEVFCMEYLLG